MKKLLLLSLCFVGLNAHAMTIKCQSDELSLTIGSNKVKVQFDEGSQHTFGYYVSSMSSPFTVVTTYHLITTLDASLVTSEKILNSRIPNCGRRVCDDDHWELSKISAKFSLQGTDYMLSCYETP
jgi:hypothetical protein